MSSVFRNCAVTVLLVCGVRSTWAADRRILRVCADPNNLPFSSQNTPGLENRLASMIATELGTKVEYSWWSERKSFLKNSLNSGKCDAVMGVPSGLDTVAVTRPYYRSSYVTVTRRDSGTAVHSLFDDSLENKRIGVHVAGDDFAPPAVVLARRGLSSNIVGFSLFGADGEANPAFRLLEALARKEIDIAVVWGPFGGYFAKAKSKDMDVSPVSPSSYFGIPFTYDISVGVRKSDRALRDEIDRVIERKRDQIRVLLDEYGIPLVGESSALGEKASTP